MIKDLFKCASIETLATGALRRVLRAVLPTIIMASTALLTSCAGGAGPSLLGQMPEILGGDKTPIKLSQAEITGLHTKMKEIAGNDVMLVDTKDWTDLLCAMKDAHALFLVHEIKRGKVEPGTVAVTCDIKPTVPDYLSGRIVSDVATEEALRETFASYLNALPKTIIGDEGVIHAKINTVTSNASLGAVHARLSEIGGLPFMTAMNAEEGALPAIVSKGARQDAVPDYVKTFMDDALRLPGLQDALGIDPVDLYKFILYHEASHANPDTARETALHSDYKEVKPQETKPAPATFVVSDPICDPAQIAQEKTERREKEVKILIGEKGSDADAFEALRKEMEPEKFKTLLDGWTEGRLASTVFIQDSSHMTSGALVAYQAHDNPSSHWMAELSNHDLVLAYEEISNTLASFGFPPGRTDEAENFLHYYTKHKGFKDPNAQKIVVEALKTMGQYRKHLGLPLPPPRRDFSLETPFVPPNPCA